jgi:phage-related tail fiber protein
VKTNQTHIAGTARTWHQSVRAVATANSAASGLLTVDGVVLADGDRCLLTAQTAGADNGVHIVHSGAWERSPDMQSGMEIEPTAHVPISEGTLNADSTYQLTTDGTIVIGTTSMTFAKVAGGGGGTSITDDQIALKAQFFGD